MLRLLLPRLMIASSTVHAHLRKLAQRPSPACAAEQVEEDDLESDTSELKLAGAELVAEMKAQAELQSRNISMRGLHQIVPQLEQLVHTASCVINFLKSVSVESADVASAGTVRYSVISAGVIV